MPASFGEWKTAAPVCEATVFAGECEQGGAGRVRTAAVAGGELLASGAGTIHVEAIQFGDRTGAVSAFTLIERPGMRGRSLASNAVGDGAVLVYGGVVGGAGESGGRRRMWRRCDRWRWGCRRCLGTGVAPLLPSLAPEKGLVDGSLRYALGPETYAAEGGVLPAQSLGWDKSAEAVTAQYADKRGKETLTMLLYPTPKIAGSFAKEIRRARRDGAGVCEAKVRREGELVMLASGGFSGDDAQRLVDGVASAAAGRHRPGHAAGLPHRGAEDLSLLTSIAILTGVLMVAAVLLGLFLGGGRALSG